MQISLNPNELVGVSLAIIRLSVGIYSREETGGGWGASAVLNPEGSFSQRKGGERKRQQLLLLKAYSLL